MDSAAPTDISKRGNKNHFTGFKLAFLRLLAGQYAIWRAEGRSGVFCDWVTRKFLRKYGTGNFHLDPSEDTGEPECDEDDGNSGCATQAEADVAKLQFDDLRAVSIHYNRKICRNSLVFCPRYSATGSELHSLVTMPPTNLPQAQRAMRGHYLTMARLVNFLVVSKASPIVAVHLSFTRRNIMRQGSHLNISGGGQTRCKSTNSTLHNSVLNRVSRGPRPLGPSQRPPQSSGGKSRKSSKLKSRRRLMLGTARWSCAMSVGWQHPRRHWTITSESVTCVVNHFFY